METAAAEPSLALPLNSLKLAKRTVVYRMFAVVYLCGILSLLYHHSRALLLLLHHTSTATSITYILVTLCLLVSDSILAFLWCTRQAFRMRPVHRMEFPERLETVLGMKRSDLPSLDIFICTADPYKEPPIDVVNTALSVMAYDYPPEKISVFVSDDGGSQLTLFAFMGAAKFARHWLPFCSRNKLLQRNPEAFFASSTASSNSETKIMKTMYESMKMRVEEVVVTGIVEDDQLFTDIEREAFSKWDHGFTRQDHPSVIQVLLEHSRDRDISGQVMPNLVYLSREKSKASPHNFKAGALNALLRLSAIMSNAPFILTLDCDTFSNDPETPYRALCYALDSSIGPKLGYVQFPQRFHGVSDNDTYASEHRGLFIIHPQGMDGLAGPNYVGAGCFFNRRSFFGTPSSLLSPHVPELSPTHAVTHSISSNVILSLAHQVVTSHFENATSWGSKMGFRYGSLVEDFFTGYRMQCEGWRGIFCDPERPAFLGDSPTNLIDALNQCKRWIIGLLQVACSKFNPITYGSRFIGPVMGFAYAHYAFWGLWSIPYTIYAFLPQLALLNGITILPVVSTPRLVLYVLLFCGAYGQDFIDFVLSGGTVRAWWNDQRMWMVRGVSCFLFGSMEYFLQSIGISAHVFDVTSKVIDKNQRKRYEQGYFEFGVASPMLVPLTSASLINLAAFVKGFVDVFVVGMRGSSTEVVGEGVQAMSVQLLIACFVVINSWPMYEAMILRRDKGRLPVKITVISSFLAWGLYTLFSVALTI